MMAGIPLLVVMLEYENVAFQESYGGILFEDYWQNLFFKEVNDFLKATLTDREIRLIPKNTATPIDRIQLDREHPEMRIANREARARTEKKYQLDYDIYEALATFVAGDALAEDLLIYVVVAGRGFELGS
jgi:hypothetical protein